MVVIYHLVFVQAVEYCLHFVGIPYVQGVGVFQGYEVDHFTLDTGVDVTVIEGCVTRNKLRFVKTEEFGVVTSVLVALIVAVQVVAINLATGSVIHVCVGHVDAYAEFIFVYVCAPTVLNRFALQSVEVFPTNAVADRRLFLTAVVHGADIAIEYRAHFRFAIEVV